MTGRELAAWTCAGVSTALVLGLFVAVARMLREMFRGW